jgi:hypothetical protein
MKTTIFLLLFVLCFASCTPRETHIVVQEGDMVTIDIPRNLDYHITEESDGDRIVKITVQTRSLPSNLPGVFRPWKQIKP